MTLRFNTEDLRLDVQLGRAAVERRRQMVADLEEAGASEGELQVARRKLALVEQFHAEDLAELKRLTTN